MEYHSVYLIFNLLYLKYQIEDTSSIKIDDLRNAFYEYQYNINSANNLHQELDFDSELENILEDFSCIFEIYDDEISFVEEDPDDLFEVIPELLEEDPTSVDIYMEDFIANENVYYALKLKPPFKEMQTIFETNQAIIALYKLITKQELENKDTSAVRKLIMFHKNNLKEFFLNADNKTHMKIRLCLAHYNDKFLKDETKPNINTNWYIALLSNDENQKVSLIYDKIFAYLDEEYEPERVESKDLINELNSEEETEEQLPINFLKDACYIADETVYFFSNFILYLNNYIKKLENSKIKKLLLEKKYLLLSTNILEDTEDYYLENGTLNDLPLPSYVREWFNEKSFDFLIGNFEEILDNIKIPNEKINTYNNAQIIINLLLLKCYLDLSINEVIKQELLAEITNPNYYKNPNYSTLTELIDSIVFQNREINHSRKK